MCKLVATLCLYFFCFQNSGRAESCTDILDKLVIIKTRTGAYFVKGPSISFYSNKTELYLFNVFDPLEASHAEIIKRQRGQGYLNDLKVARKGGDQIKYRQLVEELVTPSKSQPPTKKIRVAKYILQQRFKSIPMESPIPDSLYRDFVEYVINSGIGADDLPTLAKILSKRKIKIYENIDASKFMYWELPVIEDNVTVMKGIYLIGKPLDTFHYQLNFRFAEIAGDRHYLYKENDGFFNVATTPRALNWQIMFLKAQKSNIQPLSGTIALL